MYRDFAYTLIRKVRKYFFSFLETGVNIIVEISKPCASFATLVPFSLLAKQRCHTFFHYGTLLVLFDTLRTVPPRQMIKLTTDAAILGFLLA